MTVEEIIEKIMLLGEYTCPCEMEIPCPFFDPNKYYYCSKDSNCVQGMKLLLVEAIEKERR